MVKVFIADDHPVVRRGIKQILAEDVHLEVAGEASNGRELLDLVREQPCDVVLLDISMPARGGLDTLAELRRDYPKLPVLILSVHPEDQIGPRVLKSGAAGFVKKETAPDELITAVKKVAAGGKYITPSLAEKLAFDLATDNEKPPHEDLSDREYLVMCKIASGKTVSEIAQELSLSIKTISTYRSRILEKMKMKTNAQMTFYAIAKGLVKA